MASKQMLAVAAVIAVTFFPALTSATEHTVGDGSGWTLGFDYATWAETKQFRVGDALVFKYAQGYHNVVEVSGPDFRACTKAAGAAVWNTGDDRIDLDKAGRRWFFCGVGNHCQRGMKLNVTILPDDAPTPAPAPSTAASSPPRASRRPFVSKW